MEMTLAASSIGGSVRIPGSKSQTIRALLIALAARDVSTIHGALISQDTESCIGILKALGARVDEVGGSTLVVDSTSLVHGGDVDLYTGNSGTTTYLAYGLLGTLGLDSFTLTGDEQMNRRPIGALAEAYGRLGLKTEYLGKTGCLPVRVIGRLCGGQVSIECPTSQYLSSLLLSLPLATAPSHIDVPLLHEKPYVTITLDWLDKQGIKYEDQAGDYSAFNIPGGQAYHAFDCQISGDWSSASFFLAAAAITGGKLRLEGLDLDDSQGDKHVLEMLVSMGCTCQVEADGSLLFSGPVDGILSGGELDLNSTPDALPVLSVLGVRCKKPLALVNVANARIKETDRIACMAAELGKLGIKVDELPDGLVIHPGTPKGGQMLCGHGDHRIIMALAVLSLIMEGGLTIDDTAAASVTFPSFFKLLDSIKIGKRG